jgi:hypothetical protein
MSLFNLTFNLKDASERFKKFISHELTTSCHLISQNTITIGTDNHLLVHNIIRHDRGLRIEANIVVYFNATSILHMIRSIFDPNGMCFGSVQVFSLVDKKWEYITKYIIGKKTLREINNEIDRHAIRLRQQEKNDIFYEDEYVCQLI